jgi:hypothetical protein
MTESKIEGWSFLCRERFRGAENQCNKLGLFEVVVASFLSQIICYNSSSVLCVRFLI